MAIFRNVNMSFWTDPKVVDDYTPEDRYFMLYALTNNYTNIIGCYEISIKQMSNDLGYTKDVVENLLNRFKEVHKTIDYDFDTKELMVINWNKYNWSSSPKLDSPLYTAIESVKSDLFHDKLATIYNNRESVSQKENEEDMVLIPYRYGIDTTITITNTIPITNAITNTNTNPNPITNNIDDGTNEICNKVINRLNELTGSNFRSNTKNTVGLIRGRLNEGFTEKDLIMVVEKMCYLWGKPKKGEKDMREYLQPSTLFRPTNFENYYNKPVNIVTTNDVPIDISDF